MTNVIPLKSGDSIVGLVSRGTSAIPGGGKKFFLFCKACRPAAGSGALYPEERWPGLKITTDLTVVPRSKMGGAIPPSYVSMACPLILLNRLD